MKTKKKSNIQIFRWISLSFFIVLITVLSILHQLSVPGVGPIDALCPFGGLETIYKYLAGGDFLSKIFTSNIVLLVGTILLGVFMGRYFCGWICMFGGLQEFFEVLGRKLFRRRFQVPQKADKILRYLKYLVLLVVLVLTWKLGDLIIRPYDPFVAYAHLSTGFASVWAEFAVGLVILVLSMVGSMFYDRVFCKYLCPMGAFLGIISKVSFYRIKREESTCTNCNICDKKCPVNIKIADKPAITSAECINCLVCVTECPTKKETLFSSIFNRKARPVVIAVAGLLIYFLTIGTSMLTGYWNTAEKSLKEKSVEGVLTPDDIKGSNSIKDIADIFNINTDELYLRLNITKELVPETTLLKDIKKLTGDDAFEAESVREIVKEMLGLEVVNDSEPVVTNEQEKQPEKGAGTENKTEPASTVIKQPETVTTSPDYLNFPLEGTMSVSDVAKALNVTESDIIKKLGLKESIPLDKPLRDLKDEFGFTMPELKDRMKK